MLVADLIIKPHRERPLADCNRAPEIGGRSQALQPLQEYVMVDWYCAPKWRNAQDLAMMISSRG